MPDEVTRSPLLVYMGTNPELLAGDSKVWSRIDPNTLRENLEKFVLALHDAIPQAQSQPTGYRLNGFEVSLTIGAKGEVGFLGTGVEASGQASLKLQFSRG